ncbi:lipopolysaccharide heptosyltransferase II [Sporomusa aerivorans]|uniref:lipopolysaccharide heptosyltransferase II n=1 Tax=Sporomusa aerivorans TaxID=204936 RepID=UPI00352B0428
MTYRNILIVKLSAIGDVIHALPVASALKKCFSQARITWIVEPPAYDLLTNNPYIDEIIVFEKAKFKSLSGFYQYAPAFIKTLRAKQFDLALDLQGLFKSAAISLLSGAPRRFVYCNAREGSDKVGKRICGPNSQGHVVERYFDVVRELGCNITNPEFVINITDEEAAVAAAIAKQAGLTLESPYIVLMPGTNWPNKCWPADKFAQLADQLFASNLIPVLVGGNAEKNVISEIAAQTAILPIDISGRTTLKQLAHIIKNARAVVAGDTGPMHLAAALGTPVIALFGPTDPNRNGPYGLGHHVVTIQRDCQGCWQRQCPEGKDCLSDIDVKIVYEALKTVIVRRETS